MVICEYCGSVYSEVPDGGKCKSCGGPGLKAEKSNGEYTGHPLQDEVKAGDLVPGLGLCTSHSLSSGPGNQVIRSYTFLASTYYTATG